MRLLGKYFLSLHNISVDCGATALCRVFRPSNTGVRLVVGDSGLPEEQAAEQLWRLGTRFITSSEITNLHIYLLAVYDAVQIILWQL